MKVILDWAGTTLIILASILLTSKKASKPKIRLKVFTLFLGSNLLWIPLAILLILPGFFLTQCILLIINLKGIITCKRG